MSNELNNSWTNWHHIIHKQLLNNPEFIPQGSTLLISVSGGQDSMALMTLMDQIKKHHNWDIYAWHGDHQWHSNSKDYAVKLRNYCTQKKIKFYTNSANEVDVSTEKKARIWRYKKLIETAEEIVLNNNRNTNIYILTGHTSTDNVETFILNLARGTNLNGLKGIPKKRYLEDKFFLVRPIMLFSREDTALICKDLKIPYWEDPSNENIKIKRNLIRLNVIPNLEKIYPGCSNRISNFIGKIRNLDTERNDLSELAIIACTCNKGIKRITLNKLCKEARSTILHTLISQKSTIQLNSKNLDNLTDQIFKKRSGKVNLSKGMNVCWDEKYIHIKN